MKDPRRVPEFRDPIPLYAGHGATTRSKPDPGTAVHYYSRYSDAYLMAWARRGRRAASRSGGGGGGRKGTERDNFLRPASPTNALQASISFAFRLKMALFRLILSLLCRSFGQSWRKNGAFWRTNGLFCPSRVPFCPLDVPFCPPGGRRAEKHLKLKK